MAQAQAQTKTQDNHFTLSIPVVDANDEDHQSALLCTALLYRADVSGPKSSTNRTSRTSKLFKAGAREARSMVQGTRFRPWVGRTLVNPNPLKLSCVYFTLPSPLPFISLYHASPDEAIPPPLDRPDACAGL